MTRFDYEVHWYAQLFPQLPANDFEKLKEDIRVNGQLTPIVITREGVLLDGRHRLRIARELSITPYTILFRDVHNVRKEMSEVDFIDSVNLLRRHMTDDQRLALAVLKSDHLEQEARDRQKAGVKPPSGVSAQRSRTAIAKSVKQSQSRVRAAKKVKEQNPDTLKKVAAGSVSLKNAQKQVTEEMSSTTPRQLRTPTDLSLDLLYKARVVLAHAADAVAILSEHKSEYPRDDHTHGWMLLEIETQRLMEALEVLNRADEPAHVN
jgi:ParB-like nuclease family protein